MTDLPEGAQVIKLDAHRKKKAATKDPFFNQEEVIEHLLDLRGKAVTVTPLVAGKKRNVRMALVIGDVTDGPVKNMGALIFEEKQWEQFKSIGDRMLEAHIKSLT